MIRVGIVGSNYGLNVLAPAFRLDPRCAVAALAGGAAERTAARARQADIPRAAADWTELTDDDGIDLIAVATPPALQPGIAIRALRHGKPVLAEKPMAADLAGAVAMLGAAGRTPTAIDFGFTELPAFRKAHEMIAGGALGRMRHVSVLWHVENAATRLRLKHWKTSDTDGGGALGNLASHALHYLEWFCGPIAGLSARLSGLPDDPAIGTGVTLSLAFASGAAGSFTLHCGSAPGSGHRIEFYGADGALVLANPTLDYMKGFALAHARRPAEALSPVALADDPRAGLFPADSRIAPVSRLISRLIDAVEGAPPAAPGFAEGHRVQVLIDAVRRAHEQGRWLDVAPATERRA